MRTRIRELALVAILLSGASAKAGDAPVALGVGDAFRLFVQQAFATVMVADPAVVDVRVDDDHSIVVEPLSPGQTNLIFIDARGMVTTNVRISVCGTPPAKGCTVGHSS